MSSTPTKDSPRWWQWLATIALFAIWPVGAYLALGPWGGLVGHLVVQVTLMLIAHDASKEMEPNPWGNGSSGARHD